MDEELRLFVLKNTLDEIRKTYPYVEGMFILDEIGQIIASNASISEKDIAKTMETFGKTITKASIIGGVENLTIEGAKATANISKLNDLYLVTVAPESPNHAQMIAVSRILILTALDLLEKITPALTPGNIPRTETKQTKTETEDANAVPQEMPSQLPTREMKPKNEITACQFIVENVKGLFIKSDTAYIDKEVLTKWKETCKDKAFERVEIETFNGKTIQCKVKPIRDSKRATKGLIQVPEKILNALEIKKGELIKIKPIIE